MAIMMKVCSCCLRYASGKPNHVEAASLPAFCLCISMLLFYVTFGFPAIPWLTILENNHEYVRGANTDGFVILLFMFISTIATIIILAASICYYSRKPASFFLNHEEDSSQGYVGQQAAPLYYPPPTEGSFYA